MAEELAKILAEINENADRRARAFRERAIQGTALQRISQAEFAEHIGKITRRLEAAWEQKRERLLLDQFSRPGPPEGRR